MSGFSAAWLALREPADRAARSANLTNEVAHRLKQARPEISEREPLRILDLATGTGANPRYLSELLPPHQDWTLVDGDSQLLAAFRTRTAAWATRAGWATVQSRSGMTVSSEAMEIRFQPLRADLSTFPLAGFSERPTLVTASALLDLVSEKWAGEFVESCRAAEACVLFALTYDGRMGITPEHEDDGLIRELVNRHQLGDKGFGEALGPGATDAVASMLDRAGYLVLRARSDWQLGANDRRLQDELIAGWVRAACEAAPSEMLRFRAWERHRRNAAGDGQLEIMVGHEDLAAWPR
jgi:hypothetical protein